MKPYDIDIWERFIEAYPNFFDEVAYDVVMGSGSPIPKGTEQNIAKSFTMLTQKKADVVGVKNVKIYIVELKPDAGAAAVGQVLQYKELYKSYIDPEANPTPMIITDSFDENAKLMAWNLGVNFIEV